MNKHKVRYFDTNTGGEIDAARALDRNGVLRDGFTMRVPLTMRDSTVGRARFVDGSGTPLDPLAGGRPGYRISTNDARQSIVEDSYRKYQCEISNRYKVHDGERLCDDCNGEGYDEDGTVCDTCGGDGVMPEVADQREQGKSRFGSNNPDPTSDSARTLDQHRQTLDKMYRERDEELSNMWRNQ